MSKFNHNDRVKLTAKEDDRAWAIGSLGTVVKINTESCITVEFDEGKFGWGKNGRSWGFFDKMENLTAYVEPRDRLMQHTSNLCPVSYWNARGDGSTEDITKAHRYTKSELAGEECTFLKIILAPEFEPVATPAVELFAPLARATFEADLYPSAKIILKHLKKRNTISPMEALTAYGTMRLAARIFDLRTAGFNIETTMHQDEVGHKYARYTLNA